MCVCVCVCVCVWCALFGLCNKLYRMNGTYIKIIYQPVVCRRIMADFEMRTKGHKYIHSSVYGSHPAVLTTKQTTRIHSNTTPVYLKYSCALTCYLFRPFVRPSSGMSVQKSHKGRCNKIKSPVYRHRFV